MICVCNYDRERERESIVIETEIVWVWSVERWSRKGASMRETVNLGGGEMNEHRRSE